MPRRNSATTGIDENEKSFSIAELCRIENISISTYYNLKNEGLGPEEIYFRSTVRITADARRAWHAKLKKHRETKQAQLEQERRTALRKVAGQIAATSPRHRSKRKVERKPERTTA